MIYYMAKIDITAHDSHTLVYAGQLLTKNEYFKEFSNRDLPFFWKISTSPKNTRIMFGVRKLVSMKGVKNVEPK